MTIKEWPKPLRATLYWVAMIVMILALVPALVVAGTYILGLEACEDFPTAVGSAVCSVPGRIAAGAALIAGTFGLLLPFIRFVQRRLGSDSEAQRPFRAISRLPVGFLGRRTSLSFGQELVCGRVESHGSSGRLIQFAGSALTLWSLYPFQKGWIDEGDELILVYQRVPFSKSLKFALAFWNGAANPVRGIAPFVHAFGIAIAASCIVFFSAHPSPFNDLCLVVAAFAGVVNVAYVLLMLRAVAALRRFIADAGAL